MINVQLKHATNTDPYRQISWAARNCYLPHEADFDEKLLNVEDQLFATSHHTTHSHFYQTYFIEGISVSGITFGIHLPRNPFYNSEQRSGRFCIQMFLSPDYEKIEHYIQHYWDLDERQLGYIMKFVKNGIGIFQDNLEKATKIAAEFIQRERPFANEKYIENNAPKFAQEQLRNFVSTIFPTGDTYTLSLLSLISNYAVAWNPPMFDLTQKMADLMISKSPEMQYAFNRGTDNEYFVKVINCVPTIIFKPSESIIDIKIHPDTVYPEFQDLHPVDKTLFHPKFMNNNMSEITSFVEISTATFGQDQRHRMIDQGEVVFTGDFYLSPIARECGLEKEAFDLMSEWLDFYSDDFYPKTLVNMIAPYGAMVSYEKKSNFNPLFHEQLKRLCWCTQEEIFNLNLQKRMEVINKYFYSHPLVEMFSPPCIRCGKCTEGNRYCGRDMTKIPFIQRKV
jgi:hypothetical protein